MSIPREALLIGGALASLWLWNQASTPAPAPALPRPAGGSGNATRRHTMRRVANRPNARGWANAPQNSNQQGMGFDPVTGDYGDTNMSTTPQGDFLGAVQPNGGGFDPIDYLAANPDLIAKFGGNVDLATRHYYSKGQDEGRNTHFDALEYLASNPDLIDMLGLDPVTATQHYVFDGYYQGRRTTSFDPIAYGKTQPQLGNQYGAQIYTNPAALVLYYVTYGRQAQLDGQVANQTAG